MTHHAPRTTTRRPAQRSARRMAAVAVTAALAGAGLTASLVGGQASAQPHTSAATMPDGARPAAASEPRGYHFGSDSLLQSQDFNGAGLRIDRGTIAVYGGNGLGDCFPADSDTLYHYTGTELPEVGVDYASLRVTDQHVRETSALAPTSNAAARFVHRLDGVLRACQSRPGEADRLGHAHHARAAHGTATYYVQLDAQDHPVGGAAVLRRGAAFAVLQLNDPTAPAATVMRQLAKDGLRRLADASA